MRIRKALGAEAVRTARQGYVLDLPDDAIDGLRFEQLFRRGRELLALDEPDRARYALTQALDLWYGPALADLEGWSPGEAAAQRWEELRRDAEELRVEAALASGGWREVLTESGRLVAEQPFRESRWALLARAQYQAGRQGEALATLQRARAVLAGELGLDPGPDLAALEQSILHQDPGSSRPRRTYPTSHCARTAGCCTTTSTTPSSSSVGTPRSRPAATSWRASTWWPWSVPPAAASPRSSAPGSPPACAVRGAASR